MTFVSVGKLRDARVIELARTCTSRPPALGFVARRKFFRIRLETFGDNAANVEISSCRTTTLKVCSRTFHTTVPKRPNGNEDEKAPGSFGASVAIFVIVVSSCCLVR